MSKQVKTPEPHGKDLGPMGSLLTGTDIPIDRRRFRKWSLLGDAMNETSPAQSSDRLTCAIVGSIGFTLALSVVGLAIATLPLHRAAISSCHFSATSGYLEQEDYDPAITASIRSIARNPERAETYGLCATAYHHQARYSQALDDYSRPMT